MSKLSQAIGMIESLTIWPCAAANSRRAFRLRDAGDLESPLRSTGALRRLSLSLVVRRFYALAGFDYFGILIAMTQAVAHILDEFEQLSDAERRELRLTIVDLVPMTDDL